MATIKLSRDRRTLYLSPKFISDEGDSEESDHTILANSFANEDDLEESGYFRQILPLSTCISRILQRQASKNISLCFKHYHKASR